jgi:hypothetical protein
MPRPDEPTRMGALPTEPPANFALKRFVRVMDNNHNLYYVDFADVCLVEGDSESEGKREVSRLYFANGLVAEITLTPDELMSLFPDGRVPL